MSDPLNVTSLPEGEALVASIPARTDELIAEYGEEAQLDGSIESLNRLLQVMLAQKGKDGFEDRETELILKCFGYLATVYEGHLGAKAWIDPKLFEPNVNYHRRNPSIPRPDGVPMSLAQRTNGLFFEYSTSPAEKLKWDIEEMAKARAAAPQPAPPPPWLRSSQYSGIVFIDSPAAAEAMADKLGATVSGRAIEGSFGDWRYRADLNLSPDAELVADMTVHPDLQGTMPDLVTAVWELAGEADPDMNHFNDWVQLIQTIENAHTTTAYIDGP